MQTPQYIKDKINVLFEKRQGLVIFWIILTMGNIDIFANERVCQYLFTDLLVAAFATLGFYSKHKILKILTFIYIFTASFLSLFNFAWFYFMQYGMSIKLWNVFLLSNPTECSEYIQQLFHLVEWDNVGLIIVGFIALYWLIEKFKYKKVFITTLLPLCILGMATSAYTLNCPVGKKKVNIVLRSAIDLRYAYWAIERQSELEANVHDFGEYKTQSDSIRFDKVIFIIGESMSRHHVSLYDYPLPTTPHLDALKDSLFVFNDVVAPFFQTADVMQHLLTFKSVGDSLNWYDYPHIMHVLSQTDYETFWLSNQERGGKFSDCSGIIAKQTDSAEYVGMEYSGDHHLEKLDEILLPRFETHLTPNTKQFFVLHLMGSHTLYSKRFPENRAYFTVKDYNNYTHLNEAQKQTKADYDNSIRYTDSILGASIQYLQEHYASERILWIYLSDHGQEVFDFTADKVGHMEQSVEIPFVVWMNAKAKTTYPELEIALRNSVNGKYMIDDFIHFLLPLMGIEHPLIDSTKDFASPNFKEKVRITDGEIYQHKSLKHIAATEDRIKH